MKHRTKQFFTLSLSLVVALVATVLIASLVSAGAPSAPPERPVESGSGVVITGTVIYPGGPITLPFGTFVRLVDPIWLVDPRDSLVRGYALPDLVTGAFTMTNVPPGNYLMRAQAPDFLLGLAPSPWRPVVVLSDSIFITPPLRLSFPSITGTLFQPNGISTISGTVNVYSGSVRLDSRNTLANGDFSLGALPLGMVRLEAEPAPDVPLWRSGPVFVTVMTTPQYVSITLNGALVKGLVREGGTGGPFVGGARVTARFVQTPTLSQSDWTGPLGVYAIAGLPIPPGPGVQAVVWAEPPSDREGLMASPYVTVTLPMTLPVNLVLPTAQKYVYGYVTTNISQSVQNALIEAQRVDRPGHAVTMTTSSGLYQMRLTPGLWAINVHQTISTTPAGWIYPFPAPLVLFADNPNLETRTVNFKVFTSDATVKGKVVLPDGSTPPNFTVTVGLRQDEGLGVAQMVDASGNYTFQVPHGPYKLDARVDSHLYAAPPPTIVIALSGTVTTVPDLVLLARDALITGTVRDGTGNPVENIPVIAWSSAGRATFGANSGSDGVYAISVFSNTWNVRPAPRPEQTYIYSGTATEVNATAGSATPNVDFTVLGADAKIHGILVNGSGLPVPSRGWAGALQVPVTNPPLVNGAPIENGVFDINVIAGTYAVKLNLPSGQEFMASSVPATITLAAGETQTHTFTLIAKTALFKGAVVDPRAGASVNTVNGRADGHDGDLRTSAEVNGGLYMMPVPAGEWTINYDIFNENYVRAAGPRTFGIGVSQTLTVNLPVLRKDGLLTGTVLISRTGVLTPARGAVVVVEGASPDLEGITLRAPVGPNGFFVLRLPSGRYRVRSVIAHDPGLINPAVQAVDIPPSGSNGVTLIYQQPNAVIKGTITGAPPSLPIGVWAWNGYDGYNATIAQSGAYTLFVTGGQPWYVVAKTENLSSYWITRTFVPTFTGVTTVNLNFGAPKPKPGPVTVVFDASSDEAIELSDGTRLYIPGGALPASGRVILHITPLANGAHHRNGDVTGLNYAFEAFTEDGQAITDNFNQDVTIGFERDRNELIAQGVNPNRVKPAYFSTTTNSWTIPDSFVVRETTDKVFFTMQIDHFTDFALLSVEDSGITNVFLPLVVR